MASPTTAQRAEFQDGGQPIANPVYQVDANGNPVSPATQNAPVAAGTTTAPQPIKPTAGYLSGALVTSNATAALSIYDNASQASGTQIGYIPATATAGQFYPFNMPALLGITAGRVSGSPAVTLAFSLERYPHT